MLFVPANRGDLIAKQPRFGADVVVLDLEDGTPVAAKDEARSVLREAVPALRGDLDATLLLRVNSATDESHGADLDLYRDLDVDGLVVPKVETTDQVASLLEGLGPIASRRLLVLGLETVAGVYRSVELTEACQGRLDAVYFGAEDYVADLGGRRTSSSHEVASARAAVAVASRLAGVAAVDQAVLGLDDAEAFRYDAKMGRDLGYVGKICIHPAQVSLSHEAHTPSSVEVERARALLDCYAEAERAGLGTASFEGQMIDTPLVLQARRVLELAR